MEIFAVMVFEACLHALLDELACVKRMGVAVPLAIGQLALHTEGESLDLDPVRAMFSNEHARTTIRLAKFDLLTLINHNLSKLPCLFHVRSYLGSLMQACRMTLWSMLQKVFGIFRSRDVYQYYLEMWVT